MTLQPNDKLTDKQVKSILDLFSELNLCEFSDNISDEMGCEYSFKNIETFIIVTKRFFELMPDNWSIRYWEGENPDDSSIDIIRNFPMEKVNKK